MGTAFVSGIELTLVVATAITVSLAGMWLTRRFTTASTPAPRPAPPRPAVAHGRPSRRPARARSRMPGVRRQPADRSKPYPIAAGLKQAHSASSTLVHKTLAAISAAASGLTALAATTKKSKPAPAARAHASAIAPAPQRLSLETQWERTERTVTRAVLGAQTARAAHSAAGDKLDEAHYALEKMLGDLEGILTLKPLSAEVALFPAASNIVSLRGANARTRVAA